MSQTSEFRQRGGGQRRESSSGSLPRPGMGAPAARMSPRVSPKQPPNTARSSSYGNIPPAPFPAQRSGSYSAAPSSGYTSQSYNPNGNGYSASSSNGNGYPNGNGYSNGYSNNTTTTNGSSYSTNSHVNVLDPDDKYSKKRKAGSSSSSSIGSMGMLIGGIALFVYAILMTTLYFSTSSATKSLLKRLDLSDTMGVVHKVEDLQRKLTQSEAAARRAENDARTRTSAQLSNLEREKRLLEEDLKNHKDVHLPQANERLQKHTHREQAFSNQVGWLMDATRRESKRMVLERFGPGPHKVEVTFMVNIDDEQGAHEDDLHKKRYKFVIELAPLDLVPHAIHQFLEQVEHGLLEGSHFYLNGPHIVQSGPQPEWGHIDGNDDAFNQYTSDHSRNDKISGGAIETINKYEKQVAHKKGEIMRQHPDYEFDDDNYEAYFDESALLEEDKRTKRYADLGLDQLAFPDYHPDYPHVAWTVGYTGRPGGPDWYINKVDNTKGHGPGGQPQHALFEQGDSCFGVISAEGDGRKYLAAYVYQAETYSDHSEWHHFIASPIEIVQASILTKDPILDNHIHLTHLHSQHRVYNHRKKKTAEGESELPHSDQDRPEVHHGEGVDPNELPEGVHRYVEGKTAGKISINKVEHRGHRPHIEGSAEA